MSANTIENSDNTTPHKAIEYDTNIVKTIPYYECFHKETIDLIKSYNNKCEKWLDIGCGTGILLENAQDIFKNTKFILADPSEAMINIAKSKFSNYPKEKIDYIPGCSSQYLQNHIKEKVDVITAIQVHHYLKKEEREEATRSCFNTLKKGGLYITFENISPMSTKGIEIGLDRWGCFQVCKGKSEEMVRNHRDRFNKEYYPITILEHLELLKKTGFESYEIFWVSHMQCGFYGIK